MSGNSRKCLSSFLELLNGQGPVLLKSNITSLTTNDGIIDMASFFWHAYVTPSYSYLERYTFNFVELHSTSLRG